jgi:hypothetical protein
MKYPTLRALLHAAVAAVLTACGGGDGGIGGTGSADVSLGAITAFGSVWVNGVEFKTSALTTIKIDDNPRLESDLRVGMVARVDGSIAGATATAISVKSAIKGYVEAIAANQLVVMGQVVLIDSGTVIANGPLAAGQTVEVHGQVVSDGTLAATFIERKTLPATPPFAVTGFVKAHNTATNAFAIGALNINLGAGATINDMPAGSWNGLLVEVKGTACAGNPPTGNVCGTLTASKVEPNGVKGNIDKIEVEGFVTRFTSAASFTVGNQAVVTAGSTVFQGGTAADIVLGTKLEVEGSLSNGVLTATKVSLRENVRLEANVAAVNAAANTLTLTGLNGLTIEANAATKFSGFAGLAGVTPGAHIEVRGRPGASGHVIATEIKDGGGNTGRVIVQAIASNVARPNVTLLGLVIDLSAIGEFHDANGNAATADQFFAQAAAGRLLKVRGTLSGAVVSWDDEAELEN